MRNESISGTELVREAVLRLQAVLPDSWQLSVLEQEKHAAGPDRGRPDAALELRSPDGGSARLILECKRQLEPNLVELAIQQAKRFDGLAAVVLAAPYLSPRSRQLATAWGANYVDLTGNVRLRLERPAVFIQLAGAEENPWHETRPLASLKGNAAARVVRAVCDHLLTAHRDALVLVGAQAIYMHVGEADMAVAPFTTDGDIALDPRTLGDDPRIADAMKAAGFRMGMPPGIWLSRTNIQIDLLVPDAVGGAGRRGARLGVHGPEVARKTRGLEAALVDKSERTIGALEPSDTRQHR